MRDRTLSAKAYSSWQQHTDTHDLARGITSRWLRQTMRETRRIAIPTVSCGSTAKKTLYITMGWNWKTTRLPWGPRAATTNRPNRAHWSHARPGLKGHA